MGIFSLSFTKTGEAPTPTPSCFGQVQRPWRAEDLAGHLYWEGAEDILAGGPTHHSLWLEPSSLREPALGLCVHSTLRGQGHAHHLGFVPRSRGRHDAERWMRVQGGRTPTRGPGMSGVTLCSGTSPGPPPPTFPEGLPGVPSGLPCGARFPPPVPRCGGQLPRPMHQVGQRSPERQGRGDAGTVCGRESAHGPEEAGVSRSAFWRTNQESRDCRGKHQPHTTSRARISPLSPSALSRPQGLDEDPHSGEGLCLTPPMASELISSRNTLPGTPTIPFTRHPGAPWPATWPR